MSDKFDSFNYSFNDTYEEMSSDYKMSDTEDNLEDVVILSQSPPRNENFFYKSFEMPLVEEDLLTPDYKKKHQNLCDLNIKDDNRYFVINQSKIVKPKKTISSFYLCNPEKLKNKKNRNDAERNYNMQFHLENLNIDSSVMKYGQYKSMKRKSPSGWTANKKPIIADVKICDLNSQENLTLKCTETYQKDSPALNYNLTPCNSSECSKQGDISISDLSTESSSSVKTCEISFEDICDSNNSKKNDISNMTKTVDETFQLPIVVRKGRRSADAVSLPKSKYNYVKRMSYPTDRCNEINSSLKRNRMNSFFSLPPYDISFSKNINIGFIDTHCHLDFLFKREHFQGTYEKYQLENYETFPKNYEGCITIFCEPQSFAKKSEWEKLLKEKNVWAAFGCHPHFANKYNDDIEKDLLKALVHPRVVALGEIGLDYSSKNSCQPAIQQEVFRKQLKIAVRENLPLVIHCRDAHDDCIEILKETIKSVKGSHPGMAIHVAAQIAALRSEDTIQDILHAVRKNTYCLYGV
ncbi:uncharacterized protein LOC111628460 isoform X2 [Centruroides sculpturatus]|uniref:uncharacterized protein LOC111628460 isoform X2 n=1 Tax=Centruroides sculpturatus TaxID=218467 RepID=UPI000C6E8CC8|nr:uncharacterized protein LOC111628460 isoform X2 [Centruroides sculpturatus]